MPPEVLLIESAPHDWLLPQCACVTHPDLSAPVSTLSSCATRSLPIHGHCDVRTFSYKRWDTCPALVAAASYVHAHAEAAMLSHRRKNSCHMHQQINMVLQVRCVRPPWRRGDCGGGPDGGTPNDSGALLRGPGVLGHGRLQVTTAAVGSSCALTA